MEENARRRAGRYARRHVLWRLSGERRLRSCGRATRGETVEIHVLGTDAEKRATATGLMACGSIWSCPVCATHIRQVRALDIAEACERVMGDGGAVLFLTLTFSHHRGERLDVLLDGLVKAWTNTVRGAPWKRRAEAAGLIGTIKSVEVTDGENGWHPHLHLLLLLDAPMSDREREAFRAWLFPRWRAMVERQGLGLPDETHGLVLEQARSAAEVGLYVAKTQDGMSVGLEMARGDLKVGRRKGRTPFELLEAAGDGETHEVMRWREYEAATKGRNAITWSPGLRVKLGMNVEQTDEEVVAEAEVTAETLVAELANRTWWLVCRHRLDARLLAAAERRGLVGVLHTVALAERAEERRAERGMVTA